MLAWQFRKIKNDRTMYKIKSNNRTILTKPIDINNRSRQFYSDLYTWRCLTNPWIMNTFLNICNLPTISEEECRDLDAEISIAEIKKKQLLKSRETCGLDGLLSELYKKRNTILSPCLQRLDTQAQIDGILLSTLAKAIITVIYKWDRYIRNKLLSTVSLLNLNGKLFAKI